jgi:hypothetical protein
MGFPVDLLFENYYGLTLAAVTFFPTVPLFPCCYNQFFILTAHIFLFGNSKFLSDVYASDIPLLWGMFPLTSQ